jgi:hypothetical protein
MNPVRAKPWGILYRIPPLFYVSLRTIFEISKGDFYKNDVWGKLERVNWPPEVWR